MGLPYYAKSEVLSASTEAASLKVETLAGQEQRVAVLSASTEAASLKEVVGPEPLHDEEFYPPQPRRLH